MNLEQLYHAAYRERHGGDLGALRAEAFHYVPPPIAPVLRPDLGVRYDPVAPDHAWQNLCRLAEAIGDRTFFITGDAQALTSAHHTPAAESTGQPHHESTATPNAHTGPPQPPVSRRLNRRRRPSHPHVSPREEGT